MIYVVKSKDQSKLWEIMNENKDMNASNTFYLKHNQEIDVEYFQKKAREKNTIQIQIIEIDDKTSKLHKTIISAT